MESHSKESESMGINEEVKTMFLPGAVTPLVNLVDNSFLSYLIYIYATYLI